MKDRHRPVIAAWCMAVVWVLAMSPWSAIAGNNPGLCEQLRNAAKNGDLAKVKFLMQKGTTLNAVSRCVPTALMSAVKAGNAKLVHLLLECDADVNTAVKNGSTVLIEAAGRGHAAVVKLLLSKGADVNARRKNGDTPLMMAALGGHAAVVKLLIANGADVNLKRNDGGTALMAAAYKGDAAVVKFLISKGADVNAAIRDGSTALMAAAYKGDAEMVKLLISKGANVNAADSNYNTALMAAAYKGDAEMVKLLISKGANVNAADWNCYTALMAAAALGHLKTVQLLLNSGADPNSRDRLGLTARDYAQQERHKQVLGLLESVRTNESGGTASRTIMPSNSITTDTTCAKLTGRIKTLAGKVITCLPHNLSIWSAEENTNKSVVIELTMQTHFMPFRRPSTGELVEVKYTETHGHKVARLVRIIPSDGGVAQHIARQSPEKQSLYPNTARGVLKAFLEEGLRDILTTVDQMRLCDPIADGQGQYFPNREDVRSNTENPVVDIVPAWGFKIGKLNIATGFEIAEFRNNNNKATAKVIFHRLGWINQGDIVLRDRSILNLTKDDQQVTYRLARLAGSWRITSVCEPYLSIRSAVKWLKCRMKQLPPGSGWTTKAWQPSIEQQREMTEDIRILEKHLGH